MVRVLCLLLGYAFGMIQTAYFVGRYYKTDIRLHGSGNAGTTNALRTFGAKAAIITLLGDVLKCVAAILLVRQLFRNRYEDILPLLEFYTGMGCVLGHNFPCYLSFRGGKGIATSMGMVFALNWRMGVVLAIIFLVILLTTHYVSLGSLVGYTVGVIWFAVSAHSGAMGLTVPRAFELDVLLLCFWGLAVYRHRANIVRLLKGTENKTFLGKKR